LRSRGRSDYIADLSKLMRGVEQDTDDTFEQRGPLANAGVDSVGLKRPR
jgi:hypothetical protein